MSHLSREKLDLVNTTKNVIGQLESVLRALYEDAPCADVLQRLSAARGAIHSLMAELMEDLCRCYGVAEVLDRARILSEMRSGFQNAERIRGSDWSRPLRYGSR